ncbi:sensor histidine kinase [Enterococcus sp. LJL128]|uniref:sensor histidine kinase n=1 Tax=Enterococcus sp. LJL51 TaxID=3416656 RepID=UPI003CF9B68B
MVLWKKNFFFIFTLFQGLIFVCLLFFVSYSFQQALNKEVRSFRRLVQDNGWIAQKLTADDLSLVSREIVLSTYLQQEISVEIRREDGTVLLSLNEIEKMPAFEENQLSVFKESGKHFLTYSSSLFLQGEPSEIFYAKNVSFLYEEQQIRIFQSLIFGLGLSTVISLIIYWQMKKIYKPVQQISHELRTPLTLISGYSELMIRMKSTEEEKLMMSQDILDETRHLQEIIEQLLLMGELKEGTVAKEPIYLTELLTSLQADYPFQLVRSFKEEPVVGNRILLLRLLDNLLRNAFNASTHVEIIIKAKELVISNGGKAIPESKLKKLNRGKKLHPSEYEGSGQGFIICRDIVLLHQGKIRIVSNELGTKVIVNFP